MTIKMIGIRLTPEEAEEAKKEDQSIQQQVI